MKPEPFVFKSVRFFVNEDRTIVIDHSAIAEVRKATPKFYWSPYSYRLWYVGDLVVTNSCKISRAENVRMYVPQQKEKTK